MPAAGGSVPAAGGSPTLQPTRDAEHTSSELDFSVLRGVHDAPFDLTVTHPSATQVAYTLDCSDPRTSASALTADLPLSLRIDPADTTNRFLAPGVVVRAVALDQTEPPPGAVVTHTYLFLDRVVELSPDGDNPGGNWPDPNDSSPRGGGQSIDYGMDPNVTESAEYADQILPALLDIPSMSLVVDLPDLFDPQDGIYVNAEERGDLWERPGSIELINPDGSRGFQANTGVRIRGGYSRSDGNPKHAFRLFFRESYGADTLFFPLFEDEGPELFERVDLRTSQNYSWSFMGDTHNTMNRDVFSRDLQRDLGQPYTRSRYYHLFLDGVYWGLFQTQERSEAHFAETYFGGLDEDYDVVKVATELDYTLEATDGTLDAWQEVYDRCEAGFSSDVDYYALEGKGPDGQRDPNLRVLVDIDNLIDYLLVVFYTGNIDGPLSAFLDNESPNNFYAISSRINPELGFRFFAHDNEHTLLLHRTSGGVGLEEDRVNIGVTDQGNGLMTVDSFSKFHPQWLHHRLAENAAYRTRFAARARQLLEGTGALTPSATTALFRARRAEIELPIIAESARWGDAQQEPPLTKNDDWIPAADTIEQDYFPVRTQLVIEQLQTAGLY